MEPTEQLWPSSFGATPLAETQQGPLIARFRSSDSVGDAHVLAVPRRVRQAPRHHIQSLAVGPILVVESRRERFDPCRWWTVAESPRRVNDHSER